MGGGIVAQLGVPLVLAQGVPAPMLDPCKLLTDAEVRKYFPDAKAAVPDHSLDKEGFLRCRWQFPGGNVGIQIWNGDEGSIDDDLRGLSDGFTDPLKPGAGQNVRIEIIQGIGDAAKAIVEKRDTSKGFLSDMAVLITQRKGIRLEVGGHVLLKYDRLAALKVLEELGRAAVKRF
jgi:hypothetical protein